MYLAPLRLLALEAQEVLLDAGVDCSLTTGEEEDCREGDTHVAATAEKLNLKQPYEVAVIDECQMIADRQRGLCLDPGHPRRPGAGGPPVRCPRGQGPAGTPH